MRKILTIRNTEGVTLAYLNNLESGTCREVVNGEYTLNFVALIEPLKTEYLYDRNNLIIYNNDYFRVIGIEELHNEDNMLTVSVVAEHISYDLIQETRESFFQDDRAAIYVMNAALADTGFEFTGTDVTTTASINMQGTEENPINIRNVLFNIASIWGGELEYFRKQVSLKKQLGQNRGVDFRFGKNLQEVKRIIDYSTDPISISYDVTVVQGSELEELGYFELGDTVRVIDDALDIDHYSRIIEVEKDIITGINSKVVLGQPIADLNSSMSQLNKTLKATDKKISGVVDEHGMLIASKLSGTLSDAIEAVENSTAYITFDNMRGMISHDQPTETASTNATMWSSRGFLIANAKDTLGKWIWRTAITGESISADEITTGTLTAINVDAVTITGSTLISESATQRVTIDDGLIEVYDKSNDEVLLSAEDGHLILTAFLKTGNEEGSVLLDNTGLYFHTASGWQTSIRGQGHLSLNAPYAINLSTDYAINLNAPSVFVGGNLNVNTIKGRPCSWKGFGSLTNFDSVLTGSF